jgi:hypothetical protein
MHQRVMKPRFDRPERRQVRNVTRLLARPLRLPTEKREVVGETENQQKIERGGENDEEVLLEIF